MTFLQGKGINVPRESAHGTHRLGVGILLTAIGLLTLLSNLLDWQLGSFFGRWWPVLIVLVGLWRLVVWGAASLASALLWIGIGIICLLATLGRVDWDDIYRLWPVVLIAGGIWLLLRPTRHRAEMRRSMEGDDADTLDAWALFGGTDRHVTSQHFKGGNATALFGGIDIDLRGANLAEGEHSLHLTALFGGVDIFVPQDWDVWVTGSPVFGGLEDKRSGAQVTGKPAKGRLHINAFVMFGGIEIKN